MPSRETAICMFRDAIQFQPLRTILRRFGFFFSVCVGLSLFPPSTPKHGFAPKAMCDRMTRMGRVLSAATAQGLKCAGQKWTVRRGGGTLAFLPVASWGDLHIFHRAPVRTGSTLPQKRHCAPPVEFQECIQCLPRGTTHPSKEISHGGGALIRYSTASSLIRLLGGTG